MGAPAKLDWEAAFDEYILVHKPKGMPQYDFAAMKGVNAQWLSVRFGEIESERKMAGAKKNMPRVLEKALANIEEALDEPADRETAENRTGISVTDKAKFSLAAATAMADRLGMSPAATVINMQQLNQNKTVLAQPIFAAEAAPLLDNFLGEPDEDADKTDR